MINSLLKLDLMLGAVTREDIEAAFRDKTFVKGVAGLVSGSNAILRDLAEQKLCISCGAKTDMAGDLPCGH